VVSTRSVVNSWVPVFMDSSAVDVKGSAGVTVVFSRLLDVSPTIDGSAA